MNYTPRTNEAIDTNEEGPWVSAAFARTLEIELDTATERIKLLENGLIKIALNKLNPPGGFPYEQKHQNN
jgi:hypothetical protein